jgi:hypothetical protein
VNGKTPNLKDAQTEEAKGGRSFLSTLFVGMLVVAFGLPVLAVGLAVAVRLFCWITGLALY